MFRTSVLMALAVACTDDKTDTTGDTGATAPETIPGYIGDAPHLRVSGLVQGDLIDIDLSGAEAEDIATLFCERNYVVTAFEKYEIKYIFEYKGQAAELELTFEGAQDVGTYTLADGGPAFGVKIETADATEYENLGASGSFEISLVTGTPGGDGIIPENTGAVGGYVDVVLDDDNTFQASFSANCGANDIGE